MKKSLFLLIFFLIFLPLINVRAVGSLLSEMINFNGEKDFYVLENSGDQLLNQEFTVFLKFKSDENRLNFDTRQREILFRKGSNMMFGYEYELTERKIWLRYYVRYEDGSSQEVEWRDMKNQLTRDNQWHQVAITFKKGEFFRMYLDGKKVDDEVSKNKLIKVNKINNDFVLGARIKNDGAIDRNWRGVIDQLLIFDRAFTNEEVKNLFSPIK